MFINIIQTVFYLIVLPRKGWKRIAGRTAAHPDFIGNFLFPVFGLVALATFAGGMWAGEGGGIRWALKQAVVAVSALFGGFYAASLALNGLFPRFGLEKDPDAAQQFAGYSSVVLYLLFLVAPFLPEGTPLWILVLYTLCPAYAGTGEFLRVAGNKKRPFAVIASSLIVSVPLLIKILLEELIKRLPG